MAAGWSKMRVYNVSVFQRNKILRNETSKSKIASPNAVVIRPYGYESNVTLLFTSQEKVTVAGRLSQKYGSPSDHDSCGSTFGGLRDGYVNEVSIGDCFRASSYIMKM